MNISLEFWLLLTPQVHPAKRMRRTLDEEDIHRAMGTIKKVPYKKNHRCDTSDDQETTRKSKGPRSIFLSFLNYEYNHHYLKTASKAIICEGVGFYQKIL